MFLYQYAGNVGFLQILLHIVFDTPEEIKRFNAGIECRLSLEREYTRRLLIMYIPEGTFAYSGCNIKIRNNTYSYTNMEREREREKRKRREREKGRKGGKGEEERGEERERGIKCEYIFTYIYIYTRMCYSVQVRVYRATG